VPAQHLVSYVLPTDLSDGAMLLVAHRNAGLWLPPGGHVEPDEHPALTAGRELAEELGVPGDAVAAEPAFLASNVTVGIDAGHTDIGLWFVADVGRGTPPDSGRGRVRGGPLVDPRRAGGRRPGRLRPAPRPFPRQDRRLEGVAEEAR
jgi:8-oxo-dGTP pyrophosphatase MutT (NUDIX family)